MLCDAHVHMGYFARKGFRAPHYYSPQRVCGVLRRCNMGEFVVSSTCAQVAGISLSDLWREASEMQRVGGWRVHVFLWVSTSILEQDCNLKILDGFPYEGIKLHEEEGRWVKEHPGRLRRILSIANDRSLPVQFHSGRTEGCRPMDLARYARRFPNVRFDFAHCPDIQEMVRITSDLPNVWTDTAYWPLNRFADLSSYEWNDRLMFGTDLPVWQAHDDKGLTRHYREYVNACYQSGCADSMQRAFMSYLEGE